MTRARPLILAATLALAPGLALAVGSDDDAVPTPTETSSKCEGAQVWDEKTETCVDARESRIDDDTRYRAVRELAYDGQMERALAILDSFENPGDDRRLTYLGFVHRKSGDMAEGMRWYAAALEANPDNLLARSYMGMALAEQGDRAAARVQLTEIRARGGRETWPELALEMALRNGPRPAY
jgi:Flp pilus assembly protein TadD